jgi:predicted TPR repeat methyltransferase
VARALGLNPGYLDVYVTQESLHQRAGQASAAMAVWKPALALDPGHQLARLYLAHATAFRVAKT